MLPYFKNVIKSSNILKLQNLTFSKFSPSTECGWGMYRLSLTWLGSIYDFSTLAMVRKWYTFRRNHSLNCDLWSFPGLALCGTVLPLDTGWDGGQQIPLSNSHHEGKRLIHLQTFCTHTSILLFTFSVTFNKSREIFNTVIK